VFTFDDDDDHFEILKELFAKYCEQRKHLTYSFFISDSEKTKSIETYKDNCCGKNSLTNKQNVYSFEGGLFTKIPRRLPRDRNTDLNDI